MIGIEDVISIVAAATGISHEQMKQSEPDENLMARYTAIVILNEEGHAKGVIAEQFNIDRSTVYYALYCSDRLLKENKTMKKMYLESVKLIADKEAKA